MPIKLHGDTGFTMASQCSKELASERLKDISEKLFVPAQNKRQYEVFLKTAPTSRVKPIVIHHT